MMYIPTVLEVNIWTYVEVTALWLTVLSKTLQKRSDDHGEGTDHDAPTSSESLVGPGSKRHCKDRAQLVAGIDESKDAWLDIPLELSLAVFGLVAVAKVFVKRL